MKTAYFESTVKRIVWGEKMDGNEILLFSGNKTLKSLDCYTQIAGEKNWVFICTL